MPVLFQKHEQTRNRPARAFDRKAQENYSHGQLASKAASSSVSTLA
jgi:hypothetical protein